MGISKGAIKLAMIIAASAIILTVIVFSFLSGQVITIEGSLQALGAFAAGSLTALGLRKSGGLLVILVALGLGQTGCIGQPWQIARGTIAGAQGALTAVEPMIPADVDGRDEAIEITTAALEMGEVVVDMWEAGGESEKPLGWWKWAGAAARGFTLILDILKTAGVPIPPALAMASAALAALS